MRDDAVDPAVSSATELAAAIRAGETTATAAVEASLARIDALDDAYNAFVTVVDDGAREAATEADRALEHGDAVGPLHGVPIAVKDGRATKAGVPVTFGSRLLAGRVAERTAVLVERLEAAGAIVVGTTNVPELGHKGTTENALVGATASPIDPTLNAGGSSGGSAAAVAAGMVPLATGSDAGGSIRIPAACCAVVGVKPTSGLVPRDGRPNAYGLGLHHTAFGPLTRTVADAAVFLDVVAGPHPADPQSVPVEIDFQRALERPIDDLRVAYSPDLGVFPVDPAVESVVEDVLSALEGAGATVETVSVEHGHTMDELAAAAGTTYYVSVYAAVESMAAAGGVDVRDHPDAVSESLLAMVEAGERVTVADVAATGRPRTAVFDATQDVLSTHDVLVTPTLSRAGIALRDDLRYDEWETPLTWPFNWTDHPAASVPAGCTDAGTPVGLQIVGPRFEDDVVLAVCAAVERERPWAHLYP